VFLDLFLFVNCTPRSDPKALEEYAAAQERCAKRAPDIAMSLSNLVKKDVVFRDVTPFFATARICEPNSGGKVLLIRPRRWGKSVLGTTWVEFLRGRADLFVGTWAANKMRTEKYIGVHLDLSLGGPFVPLCVEVMMDAINQGLELAEKVKGYGERAKGRRLSLEAPVFQTGVKKSPADWSVADCMSIVGDFLDELRSIAGDAGRDVAIFVDDYDRPSVKALNEPTFQDFNKFFLDFYTQLKADSDFIPFLFVNGSHRLTITHFFGGANDITDLSCESEATTALGYTWGEIEQLYREQFLL
jgi:hypothetical protein